MAMYYHALLRIYGGHEFWGNVDRETIIREVVIPYVNRQVISVNSDNDRALMNLGSVTYLRILRTDDKIQRGVQEALELATDPSKLCTDEVVDEARLSRVSERARSILQLAFLPPSRQVFVSMRIGDPELDSVYRNTIRPSIERWGYRAVRADEIPDSGVITDQVFEEIARSEIVLCDLSGERPNCYYEAGFAHALGKVTLLTIRKSDQIHSDLAGLRFVRWETPAELQASLETLLRALRTERREGPRQ
jgi:hypothetical protein